MTTTTATRLGPIFTELTAIHGFMRAVAGDLPDPGSITVHGGTYPTAHILFDSLDGLREWAAYLQVSIEARDCRERHQQIHHCTDAKWGPVDGKMVTFEMVYVEHVEPAAIPRDCEAGEWS